MAMFGSRLRGLTDELPEEVGGGSMYSPPQMQPAMPQMAMQPQAAPQGDGLRNIIGIIGDGLLGAAGQQGQYGPMMAARAAQERALAQRKQMQQDDAGLDWHKFVAQEQWKRDNPAPKNNDTINDFEWYKNLSEPDRALYQQMKPVYRQGPDGQFYRVETGTPPAMSAEEWDSAQPMGGPTPSASGGFRP